jgi:hypothetical protein
MGTHGARFDRAGDGPPAGVVGLDQDAFAGDALVMGGGPSLDRSRAARPRGHRRYTGARLGRTYAEAPEEGDLVAVHSHYVDTPGERGRSVIDLFRVRDARIVEHWSSEQAVPETAANDSTMF